MTSSPVLTEPVNSTRAPEQVQEILPCAPDAWLAALASGWRFADWIVDLTEWNCDWPVCLLVREAA